MDMREASAMTEASGLTNDPDMPGAAKVSESRLPAASLSAQLRKMTLETPHRPCRSRASCSGGQRARTGASARTLICLIWAVMRSVRDGKGLPPKRIKGLPPKRIALLQRSARALPERPHWSSSANRSDGKPNAGGKKPPESGNASAGRRRSRRLKRLSMKPGRSTKPGPAPSMPNARQSTKKPRTRRRVGRSKGRTSRPHCDELADSARRIRGRSSITDRPY